MKDFSTLHRGQDNKFYFSDGTQLEAPIFSQEIWNCEEAYKFAKIRGYEPMTAKELETEEQQDEALNSSEYFIEEKFDGTRGILQFFSQECIESGEIVDAIGWCRVFSRRISKKTNFYTENTDSVPQLRDIDVPSLDGTVLDGEMFINGRPFKDVSSTLNCLWDKAIDRQIELGFITFHAFDIIKYKGIDLRKMPLHRRKVYLRLAIEEANSPYIEEVKYYDCGGKLPIGVNEIAHRGGDTKEYFKQLDHLKDVYPNLYNCWVSDFHNLTPRAYYEMIVLTGGEGVIVKPKNGKYRHKRGWEYSKIKKFLTRELILIGFDEPTREYKGKAPKNWAYYEGDTPVTKHYYNKQVDNMLLGVIISNEEYNSIPKNKREELYTVDNNTVMLVCECGGYDDETRAYFTRNINKVVGSVVEVKANEIFKDTGKLRHPRYLRMRYDKEAERCTWKDHIGGE